MTQGHIGQMVPSVQQLFAEQDGIRRFLEAVIQQAMSVEVEDHLGAGRHERVANRSGWPRISIKPLDTHGYAP